MPVGNGEFARIAMRGDLSEFAVLSRFVGSSVAATRWFVMETGPIVVVSCVQTKSTTQMQRGVRAENELNILSGLVNPRTTRVLQ